MFCELLYFSSQLFFQRHKNHRKKTPQQLLQRSVSHGMNCRMRFQDRRFFIKERSCQPPCKQEVTVFLCETVLTQNFTEGKDQFNHLSTMLKGKRKSCFTDLSKDKIKGLYESQLGHIDWNSTPSLNKAPETQMKKCCLCLNS